VRIPEHIIEQIRDQADIVEVIGEHVRLKKNGRNYLGLCPFHNEKTPSFNVNPDRGIYKCFGCGKAGNVFTFVSEYQKLTFVDAVRALAQRLGIVIPDEERDDPTGMHARRDAARAALREAAMVYARNLETSEGKHARAYFDKRGFSDETIAAFQLGYSSESWDAMLNHLRANGYTNENIIDAGLAVAREDGRMYDRFRGRAMFTLCDDVGRVVGFSARILSDTPGQPKYINSPQSLVYDKSRILYGLHLAKRAIREANMAILVEGQADVVTMHQHGFHATIASSGTAFTPSHAATIKRYAEFITIVFDADEAGQNATTRSIEVALAAGLGVNVVSMPPGSDPDSLLQSEGSDAMQELINEARPWIRWQAMRSEQLGLTSDPVGRSKMVRTMLQWVRNVPDALQRPFLVRELADAFRLDENLLLRELDGIREVRPPGSTIPEPIAKQVSPTITTPDVSPSAPPRSTVVLPPERELLRVALCVDHGMEILLNAYHVTAETFISERGRMLFTKVLIASEEHPNVLHFMANDPSLPEDERNELLGMVDNTATPSKKWLDFDVEIPTFNPEPVIRAALSQLRFLLLTEEINQRVQLAESIADLDERQRVHAEVLALIAERRTLSVFFTDSPTPSSSQWPAADLP
jgi:DNA primase